MKESALRHEKLQTGLPPSCYVESSLSDDITDTFLTFPPRTCCHLPSLDITTLALVDTLDVWTLTFICETGYVKSLGEEED
ncbi:unnamed protein product [Allacma fusca]|uniref:Uncharacterized protein n=1 Tax=Allacma fusca TaxID=39272 RepID=A0A8J2L4Z8_9HEXA|nr:unnamed protein product [Allacma fusca]